jgi:hypothetical protein
MSLDKWDIILLPASFSPWKPTKDYTKKISELISGGVDSSSAAYLLNEYDLNV